jgi:hypothetical protein
MMQHNSSVAINKRCTDIASCVVLCPFDFDIKVIKSIPAQINLAHFNLPIYYLILKYDDAI